MLIAATVYGFFPPPGPDAGHLEMLNRRIRRIANGIMREEGDDTVDKKRVGSPPNWPEWSAVFKNVAPDRHVVSVAVMTAFTGRGEGIRRARGLVVREY